MDRTGNRPVLSIYTVPSWMSASAAKQNTWVSPSVVNVSFGGLVSSLLEVVGGFRLVDQTFCFMRLRWPFAVAADSWRYFLMALVVRPGHVEK